jgi:hypothetical protein
MSPFDLKLIIRRYGARNMMPPKKPIMPNMIPTIENLCRHASHNPESVRKHIKSKLNCPAQVMAAMSPKKTGKRFHPWF